MKIRFLLPPSPPPPPLPHWPEIFHAGDVELQRLGWLLLARENSNSRYSQSETPRIRVELRHQYGKFSLSLSRGTNWARELKPLFIEYPYFGPVLYTLTRLCLVYCDSTTSMDLISTGNTPETVGTLHQRINSALLSFAKSCWQLSRKNLHRAGSRDSCWRQPWPLACQQLTRRMRSANWREF